MNGYDKQKASDLIEQFIKNTDNENETCAAFDLRYALSLALIAYSSHLQIWSDIPEHSNQDTREYFAALHNIHKTLVGAGVFDELE